MRHTVRGFKMSERTVLKVLLPMPSVIHTVISEPGVYLAGGAIRSAFDGTPIQDYDLFFKSKAYRDRVETSLVESGAMKVVFRCPKGFLTTLKRGSLKVQLISEFYYETAEELIRTFDITASMFCLTNIGESEYLYTSEQAIRDTLKKRLAFNLISYPIATYNRIEKYKAKGYKLTPDDLQNYLTETHFLIEGTRFEEPLEDGSRPTNNMWRHYID